MSHLKERSEKNCLNCGTTVAGRYCQLCGQENVEVKESFVHLIMHFIEDLTHFDGKLWKTLKLLLFQPGILTKYYMEGKRAMYIHPIRMYLFISAVFFLFTFNGEIPDKPAPINFSANAKPPRDIASELNNGFNIKLGDETDTVTYKTIPAYEAAQQKLPIDKRENWLEARMSKKVIEINNKYEGDKFKIGKAMIEKFEHYFSRMLYISLPLFALIIWLLYRRNKQHYFVDHLIYSIHIYCAFFIIFFFVKLINLGIEWAMQKPAVTVTKYASIVMLFYLYKSLRNHFNQSRIKTIVKLSILTLLTLILMGLLMLLFVFFSFFNI